MRSTPQTESDMNNPSHRAPPSQESSQGSVGVERIQENVAGPVPSDPHQREMDFGLWGGQSNTRPPIRKTMSSSPEPVTCPGKGTLQLWRRTLSWERILGGAGGPRPSQEAPEGGAPARDGGVRTDAESQGRNCWPWPVSRAMGAASEAGKDKETDPPLGPPGGPRPWGTFTLVQRDP